MRLLQASLGVLALVSSGLAHEGERDHDFGPVRERVERELSRGVPSIAIAVVADGAIVWEEGLGLADQAEHVPATEHTRYTLCSVAKGVTATGLMVLVERGLVDLDAPVNDYLGEAKLRGRVGDADAATVRRVANHTSGLPRWYNFYLDDEPFRRPPMDETIRRYGNLVWEVGEFRYSNLGYGVLDYVIERVSKKSFAEFMKKEVFVPLGMTHSSVLLDPDLRALDSIRYERDGTALPTFDTDNRGGGAIFSSAHDMALFALFLMGASPERQKRILSDASIAEMFRPTARRDARRELGVAWHLSTAEDGTRLVEHWGAMPGATTGFTCVPARHCAVVVLSNGDSVGVTRLRDLTLEALGYGDLVDAEEEHEEGSEKPAGPTPELVGAWEGVVDTYEGEIPIELEVRADGTVRGRLGDGSWMDLSNVGFDDDGSLTGMMMGAVLDTEDVRARHPQHALGLLLKRRGDRLTGEAMAFAYETNDRTVTLTHWTELKRKPGGG